MAQGRPSLDTTEVRFLTRHRHAVVSSVSSDFFHYVDSILPNLTPLGNAFMILFEVSK